MKLEVGKYYLRKDGVKVGPANFRNDSTYSHGGYWVLDGWFYNEKGRHLHGYDSKGLISEIPPVLKLEEGKYYLTRGGVKVGPMKKICKDYKYPWGFTEGEGSHFFCLYKENGERYRSVNSCNSDADDLVSEWEESTTMDIKVGDIVEHREFSDSAWSQAIWEVLAISGNNAWVKSGGYVPRTTTLKSLRKPAPKPVVKELVMVGYVVSDGMFFNSNVTECYLDTHRITLNLVDGVPDVTSIKMEKL